MDGWVEKDEWVDCCMLLDGLINSFKYVNE